MGMRDASAILLLVKHHGAGAVAMAEKPLLAQKRES